jgi:glycerol-3-phosphate dehydrogenase
MRSAVRFKWSGVIDDDEEEAFARAVVAAAGPFVTDAWALERSRQDRRAVEEVRFPAWSST